MLCTPNQWFEGAVRNSWVLFELVVRILKQNVITFTSQSLRLMSTVALPMRFDVVRRFTNVPVDKTCEIVVMMAKRLDGKKLPERTQPSIGNFDLLKLCLYNLFSMT